MPLKYFNQIVSKGLTYSIDKIIIRGSFNPTVQIEDFPNEFRSVPFLYHFQQLLYFNDDACISQHYDGGGFMQFKDLWKVKFSSGETAVFGFGLNGFNRSDLSRWKVEFNPNKCFPDALLSTLLYYCISNSSNPYISSLDFAVDVPLPREDFFLLKDNRKYQLVMNSVKDKTEYLGCRHEMGFCKLYNKQIESKLDKPMTRFEITACLDNDVSVFSISEILSRVPAIYYFDSMQLTHDEMSLNGTDRVLLEYALINPQSVTMLGRKMREKIQGYLNRHIKQLELDKDIFMKLYQWVSELV